MIINYLKRVAGISHSSFTKTQERSNILAANIQALAAPSLTEICPYIAVSSPLSISYPVPEPEETTNTVHLKLAYVKPLPDISLEIKISKRVFDLLFSGLVMVLGCPIFLILYITTLISSKGSAIYKQERIGKNQRPFYIYKFRSMHLNAEAAGPQLSSETDPRITKWGRVIRRTRLDELPQFWNVFLGEMSVVGPRPERQHFIDQIVSINPDYKYLQTLKPGITSLGQVHYGYAENVEQMCTRMLHDLDYLQQISLRADINVILKTIQVMIQCKGK